MSVNEKDLKALQGMWNNAKPQTDCSLPDGVYEFLIIEASFKVTTNGIPQMNMKYEVTGGNETFIGEKVAQRDNLQSPENMGWFKKKLARLGITVPEDVAELTTRIPRELVGKKFAGQLKTKDEFVNVYVNKFIEDVDMSDRQEHAGQASEEEEVKEEKANFAEGDKVCFTSVKGGEIEGEYLGLNDKGLARVKTAEGKVFAVAVDKLSLTPQAEAAEEETVEETEEETAEANEAEVSAEEGAFPTVEEVKAMKLPELKKVLAENDMDINAIKNPRIFVTGMAGFMYDEKYMPDLATLVALRDGLGVKLVKNEKLQDTKKRVLAELHKRFEF